MDPLASHPFAVPVTVFQQNYDIWDWPLPPVPGAKLRLMCSYGGHIIPRPHDKSLCYIGGDTRIVVVDRQSSFSDLHALLSHTLLNGNKFTLKYQLPNEDLDSLVSVTTYEDLQHMIEEYDRTTLASPNLKPCRLRLFLFLNKIETAASMGSLLDDDVKSGTWFNADLLSRGLSDSAAVDNLLELYNIPESDSLEDLDSQNEPLAKNVTQEVHFTMPDSPMVETTSSLESIISSHSMGNTPPIAVKVVDNHTNATSQDQIIVLNEQFSHINVASNEQKLDEKTDHGAPTRLRKLLLRHLSIQQKNGDCYSLPSPDSKRVGGGNYDLPSPDSVARESIASVVSLSKHVICQDATPVTSPENGVPFTVVDHKNNIMGTNSQTQWQQVQDSLVTPTPQKNQQHQPQFIPASSHYIQHTATGPVITPSYYPMHAPQSQQPMHQQVGQQFQMIFIPVPRMTMQSNIGDPNLYRTAPPRGVQVLSSQFQQQYFGLSQVPSGAAVSTANANLSYEYSHPMHDQVYYAQHPAPPLPLQYQTMTPAAAVLFSQASAQLTVENTNSQNITSLSKIRCLRIDRIQV